MSTGTPVPAQAAYAGLALSTMMPAAAVPKVAISSLAAQRNFIDSLIAVQDDSGLTEVHLSPEVSSLF